LLDVAQIPFLPGRKIPLYAEDRPVCHILHDDHMIPHRDDGKLFPYLAAQFRSIYSFDILAFS